MVWVHAAKSTGLASNGGVLDLRRNSSRPRDVGNLYSSALAPSVQSLAPSTSLWVTRIVRGQPWASESRTQ